MSKLILVSLYIFVLPIITSAIEEVPIRITQQPLSQVALKGSRVVFKCDYESLNSGLFATTAAPTAHSSDYIKTKWLFSTINRNVFLNDEPVLTAGQFIFELNSLVILSYDPSLHTGQYRCIINNTMYTPALVLLSEPANLSLANIDYFESNKNNNDDQVLLNMSEGNVAIISCKLPASNPPAIPIFYFNENILSISSAMSVNNDYNNGVGRYRIFPSGNLQISNVKYSDSGSYRCSAVNPVTNEIRNSTKKTILKVYEPIGLKLPEIVYVPVDTNRIQIGSNLTLECVANGAPVPLVSWEKFGGILPEKRSQQIFGNLILTNVQPEDKGTYVCRAENGPGQTTFKTAMIDIFEAPTLIKSGEEDTKYKIEVRKGENVELKCPIKSRPRSDIQWFYQGRLILSTNSNQRITTIGDKSILTIRSYQPSQSTGIYQCYAQNEYGHAQANILLIESSFEPIIPKQRLLSVDNELLLSQGQPKRPIIIMGPQNTTIYEGQSVVLLCITSETSTNTQINWLQNDLIIEPTLMRRFEINQLLGNLRIVSIQKSDAGIYKCIASNEYGMSTAEAYVQVKSGSGSDSSANDQADSGDQFVREQFNKHNKKTQKPVDDQKKSPVAISASRPTIQQIGVDKILLKWQLVDNHGTPVQNTDKDISINIAYFKVEYKTNKQQQQIPGVQPHTWLTIDEQIDPKKREYILTDLSKYETYRFRITTFFLNGELSHSFQSSRFKLEQTWTVKESLQNNNPVTQPSQSSSSVSSSSTSVLSNDNFKLSQIQVQITQIWAISSSSLGLKWDIFISKHELNNSVLSAKINGFYIYYRKIKQAKSGDNSVETPIQPVQLYNYTRINLPIFLIDTQYDAAAENNLKSIAEQQMIDTYIIANLEPSTQYEIKMTCYNKNGDLCSFSNTIYGLTLASGSFGTNPHLNNNKNKVIKQATPMMPQQNVAVSQVNKTSINDTYFVILVVVLIVLVIVLIAFVALCIIKQRQHKSFLAQLHNTSQKLTSSSCPTLIYEDSLRNNPNRNMSHHNNLSTMQHQQLQQQQQHLLQQQKLANSNYNTSKLIDTNLSSNTSCNNDSNSTNSQSMSTTTTSSMTTPSAMVSAQTNLDQQQIANSQSSSILAPAAHVLLLNGNTVSSASIPPPPPVPQVPPPSIGSSSTVNPGTTLGRININLNPLNGFLETNLRNQHLLQQSQQHQSVPLSPINQQINKQNHQENFYHTLTTLGTLPQNIDLNEVATANYASEYNNATLNMRAHLLLKQQQQQQLLMNTLKTMNLKQQQQHQQHNYMQYGCNEELVVNEPINNSNLINTQHKNGKSPSSASMRRQSSSSSSKKSKKNKHQQQIHQHQIMQSSNNQINDTSINANDNLLLQLQLQQQQQAKNYYLLPNIRAGTQQGLMSPSVNVNRNIYNDVDLLTLEAAINQNNLTLFNNGLAGAGANIYLLNNQMHHPYQPTISTFLPQQVQQHQQILSPSKELHLSPKPNNIEINNISNMPLFMYESNKNQTSNKDNAIYESSDIDANTEHEPMLSTNQNSNNINSQEQNQEEKHQLLN